MAKVKNRYKLAFIIVAVISCILMIGEISLAWFMSDAFTDNSGDSVKVIGTIDLEVKYDFSFYNDALSPDTYYLQNKTNDNPTKTTVKTTDKNNIDLVFVKIKFITDTEQLTLYFENNLITAGITEYDEDTCLNKWFLNNYAMIDKGEGVVHHEYEYYYIGLVGNVEVQFNKGFYVSNHIDNSFAKKDVYIKMEVYGIQSQYGAYIYEDDWKDSPEIFQSYAAEVTGYAKEEPAS